MNNYNYEYDQICDISPSYLYVFRAYKVIFFCVLKIVWTLQSELLAVIFIQVTVLYQHNINNTKNIHLNIQKGHTMFYSTFLHI